MITLTQTSKCAHIAIHQLTLCHRGELCDYFAYRKKYLFSFSATVSSVEIYLNHTKRGKNRFNLSCIVFLMGYLETELFYFIVQSVAVLVRHKDVR